MIHIHGLHWLVLSDLSIGFQEVSYTVSESAGVIELTVSPDGTGGVPDVGVPLGVRITSRDGSAEGTVFVCVCVCGGGGGIWTANYVVLYHVQLVETTMVWCLLTTSVPLLPEVLWYESILLMMH